jgi:polyphosphate kinase 2 PPK2
MIRHTSTPDAPWYVVPADNKWFTRVVIAAAIIQTLDSLHLKYPDVGPDKLKEIAAARAALTLIALRQFKDIGYEAIEFRRE